MAKCKICGGTGWAPAPARRVLELEDGKRVEYPTVQRCTACDRAPAPEPQLDRKSRAAGEPEDTDPHAEKRGDA